MHGRVLPSIKEILSKSANRLRKVVRSPIKEVSTLLAHSLQVSDIWLISHDDEIIEIPKDFEKFIKKREASYPLEYILKQTSFYGKEFYTDDRVLIPRPETEILVEKVVSICKNMQNITIVEIGTGSGVISVMLAILLPSAQIIATDISEDALKVAIINAKRYNVQDKIEFVRCNLLDDVSEKIDVLVSNPPYIKKDEKLDKNLSYEPRCALFGGEKGDEILKQIIDEVVQRDIKILACEMGYDQKEKIENYLVNYNLNAEFYKDLAGIDRGFVIKNRNKNATIQPPI